MEQSICKPIILLLMHIYLVENPAEGKCVLGDGLLNPLVGPSGVQQKDDYVAEENVFGWSSGPLDGITSNLTESELKDCLQEYDKALTIGGGRPLPPGVIPEKDPSQQPYLPPASGKDVLINDNGKGNGHGGYYYTTYDGSKYKFKEKGYVIDPPSTDSSKGTQTTTPAPTSKPKPSSQGELKPKPSPPPASATQQPEKGSSRKNKDELQQWYKAFVSVVSKYM